MDKKEFDNTAKGLFTHCSEIMKNIDINSPEWDLMWDVMKCIKEYFEYRDVE